MSMVEWKKLGEICEIKTGRGITQKDCTEKGLYPVISGGQTPMGMYNQYNREAHNITISRVGANAGYVSYIWQRFYLNDKCFSIIPFNDTIYNKRYLYTILKSKEDGIRKLQSEGGVPTINTQKLSSLIIPVPSLSEQQRIVGILDTFTSSIDNLKEQIAQRRKQYEYYRCCLFSTVKWDEVKIGELTKVFSCPRVFKDQWQDSGVPFWRSSDIMSYHNGVINPRGEVFISQSLYDELSSKSDKIKEGDILVTGGGSIGIPYLKKDNSPLFVKDADLICIQKCSSIIPKYLYHYFLSTDFKLYLKKITHDATIAHYTINQIKDTPIPLPPLSEQSRIVSILDTFEESIRNLEEQLAQRQKQYEYYRNKLLTFE